MLRQQGQKRPRWRFLTSGLFDLLRSAALRIDKIEHKSALPAADCYFVAPSCRPLMGSHVAGNPDSILSSALWNLQIPGKA